MTDPSECHTVPNVLAVWVEHLLLDQASQIGAGISTPAGSYRSQGF